MSDTYILDENKQPVLEMDHTKRHAWIASLPEKQRTSIGCVVAKWQDKSNPEISVSTVFLGIDHRHDRGGPPILFETMVFGGDRDMDCERYSTWKEAEDGHAIIVKELKESLN